MSPGWILLVESDEQDRALIQGLLGELGYDAVACADPGSALAAMRDALPALVLTAYPLPTSTGGDFVAAIRQRSPDLCIVGMVRRGMREVARDALTHGCKEFVSKPIDPELLARLLASLLTPGAAPRIGAEATPRIDADATPPRIEAEATPRIEADPAPTRIEADATPAQPEPKPEIPPS